MNARAYKTQYAYHIRWAAKYWLAALWCMLLAAIAWPGRAGITALVTGYGFAWLGRRERRRAQRVHP